ncbi:hypothetical protein Rhopal_007029-T1 [Rhodotorula paludigena]|uniref:Proteophosphoglycan ppg4 n=1 Tax=Rhodotorula paludigena TaxID=86838 RepID=A0AAV5GY54_9BASI|nr:hypothetical protein Rhopal_007029-T1 [Rhodotorula paludigena]
MARSVDAKTLHDSPGLDEDSPAPSSSPRDDSSIRLVNPSPARPTRSAALQDSSSPAPPLDSPLRDPWASLAGAHRLLPSTDDDFAPAAAVAATHSRSSSFSSTLKHRLNPFASGESAPPPGSPDSVRSDAATYARSPSPESLPPSPPSAPSISLVTVLPSGTALASIPGARGVAALVPSSTLTASSTQLPAPKRAFSFGKRVLAPHQVSSDAPSTKKRTGGGLLKGALARAAALTFRRRPGAPSSVKRRSPGNKGVAIVQHVVADSSARGMSKGKGAKKRPRESSGSARSRIAREEHERAREQDGALLAGEDDELGDTAGSAWAAASPAQKSAAYFASRSLFSPASHTPYRPSSTRKKRLVALPSLLSSPAAPPSSSAKKVRNRPRPVPRRRDGGSALFAAGAGGTYEAAGWEDEEVGEEADEFGVAAFGGEERRIERISATANISRTSASPRHARRPTAELEFTRPLHLTPRAGSASGRSSHGALSNLNHGTTPRGPAGRLRDAHDNGAKGAPTLATPEGVSPFKLSANFDTRDAVAGDGAEEEEKEDEWEDEPVFGEIDELVAVVDRCARPSFGLVGRGEGPFSLCDDDEGTEPVSQANGVYAAESRSTSPSRIQLTPQPSATPSSSLPSSSSSSSSPAPARAAFASSPAFPLAPHDLVARAQLAEQAQGVFRQHAHAHAVEELEKGVRGGGGEGEGRARERKVLRARQA